MSARRILLCVLMVCVVAPAVHATELMKSTSWTPDWLLDLIVWFRANVENDPASTSQRYGGYIVPTG